MKYRSTVFFILLWILLVFSLGLGLPAAKGEPWPGLKIICVWSLAAGSPEAVDSAVGKAGQLGFNAVCWEKPGVVEAAHRHGMKAFAIIEPLRRRPGAQMQELAPGEDRLTGFDPASIQADQFYQFGGEPARGRHEILDQNFTCPNDPGVMAYSLGRVAELREGGYDGLILDFIGYRNYHSCECLLCRQNLDRYRKEHPALTGQAARDSYYETLLVDLYAALYNEAKAAAPGLIVANHIHPVFLPDIFYGLKIKSDYCGITVAWFFQPHWTLAKVREYTRKVVAGPYLGQSITGMPMLGIYTDGAYARDRKSPERLAREFAILKEAGAQAVIVCELGHILRDRETARVIQAELSCGQKDSSGQ